MKKILTTLVVIGLSTFSANAIENFSITAGIAQNSAVYGATAKETNRTDTNTIGHIKDESGVFTNSHSSGFIEVNAGEFISVGFEHTPDGISTPTNTTRHGNPAGENNVSVTFNDLNITYLKLNIPGGAYLKAGYVETDMDIKEVMGSGSTYKNVSTEGTLTAIGYQRNLGDSAVSIRVEGSYMELDPVTTSNGVSASGATVANGGRNQIDADNLEGLNAKIALTFTLGGN
jgi:hypothetical protein